MVTNVGTIDALATVVDVVEASLDRMLALLLDVEDETVGMREFGCKKTG